MAGELPVEKATETTESSTAASGAPAAGTGLRGLFHRAPRPRDLRLVLRGDLLANLFAPAVAALAALWLVIPTLAPSVAAWDTAEFQTVAPVLGTGHPTGYPAYVILGFIATHLLPFGDMAYRMNLLQALLAALTVACTVGIVQVLSGRRLVALATGVALLAMPTWSASMAQFPVPKFNSTPLFWRMATHADYHMFHVALVSLLFLLLVVWAGRRRSESADLRRHADRWLVAAAIVYGVAFANHGLAYLLPPAIALFVLAVAPAILTQWRLLATCAGALVVTIVVLFAELPIRAAMHAPLVYGHPDSLQGFVYVVMGQQFGGSLVDPFGQLPAKLGVFYGLMGSWLGPLGIAALVGIGTSLVYRPRFTLLALLSAAATAAFAVAYVNADIERYFLVPLYVGFVFAGLGLADMISLGAWLAGRLRDEPAGVEAPTGERAGAPEAEAAPAPSASRAGDGLPWVLVAGLVVEVAVATAIVVACLNVVPVRQSPTSVPGGISLADDYGRRQWMQAMLAPANQGGLPANSVIVSWWSDSTTLWYGQKVEGLRPDILIVDDSDRVDNGVVVMQVWDVIDKYLGQRAVFVDRLPGNGDNMDGLRTRYNMSDYQLPDGSTIAMVVSKKGQP